MTQSLPLTCLGLLVVLLGSAVYTLAPSYAYALVSVALLTLVANHSFQRSVLDYLPPTRLAGVLLLNVFFVLATLRDNLDLRIRLTHLVSLGTFLIVFATARVALQSKANENPARVLALASLGALLVLFSGQLAEILGFIAHQDSGIAESELSLGQRPGGFLNANMTAAVALTLLYILFELPPERTRGLQAVALTTFIVSLALTQSRSGALFGSMYLCGLVLRRRLDFGPLLFVLVAVVVPTMLYLEESLLQLFLDSLAGRFERDFSYNERLRALGTAIALFGDSPLFGHGYRFVQHLMGVSTHNEIIENAVNFGILGSIVVWVSFFLIYQPRSVSFVVACIAPSLLFSHNFFETVTLQAVLGAACVVARLNSFRGPDATLHAVDASRPSPGQAVLS